MSTEHVPMDAYALLRRMKVNTKVRKPGGNPDDDAAVGFLLTRGLAKESEDGKDITITEAGLAIGRITHAAPK